MRINIILIILSLVIIAFLVVIFKKYFSKSEHFLTPPLSHAEVCCGYKPFYSLKLDEDFEDECSHGEYVNSIPDFHVNRFFDPSNYPPELKIHYVDPRNPCCLRTCINDFTYTPENINPGETREIGNFKEFIPLDLLGTSQCDQCINNFKSAVGLMAEPDRCETDFE